jgi:cytochrome bd-type quinol oxidase subunit 2
MLGLLILSVALGFRAAYDLNESTFSLNLAIDPSTIDSLPYTRLLLGEYTACIMVFMAASLVLAGICNSKWPDISIHCRVSNIFIAFLLCAILKARRSTSDHTLPFILSILLDTGIFITVLLAFMLSVQLISKTGIVFASENAVSVPAILRHLYDH